ncbi:hypothetical protein DICVIV_10904 [Dictyocaulus viviparus]|uniref:Uncharacterized protein n=1 Tax=Dictyocaulus viviparus TaxID=29172 RepID=A0A0D8XH95_DICVI|nr:hypothetical protein DICVIV_10904 [Dictyocaulus viviparus]
MLTDRLLLSLLVAVVGVDVLQSCMVGGADDYEFIDDPVFSMDISPPVGWTYFPQKSSDNYQIWYFVGQSNDSLIAKQRANNEINAAMIEAMASANMPVYGVEIANDYSPVQIENPTNNIKGVGSLYGKVEGGAVTQVSSGGVGDLQFHSYTVAVRVSVRNIVNTRYKWNLVKNTFMQKLSLNFNARFNGEVTINKY